MRWRRWQLVVAAFGSGVAALFLVSLALAPSTTFVPARGGAYVEGVVGRPQLINPLLSPVNAVERDLVALVFSGLARVNDQGQIVPDLAARWEVSPDGKVYTFYLRPDAKWHDGYPLRAEDVLFTVQTLQDPRFSPANPGLAELWKGVGAEKIDEGTVRFRLPDAYAPFLEYTTLGLLPAHILAGTAPQELSGHPFNGAPVGTGPFRVRSASVEQVELQAFPDYYGPKPYLDKVVLRFYPNERAALAALRQRQIQGLGGVSPEDVAALRADERINLYSAPEFSKAAVLFLNMRSPLLGDKTVRQAMAYGIDRRRLIEKALQGQGVPAEGPIVPASWAYRPGVQRGDGRLEEARALLEQAGWQDQDGDGIREKEGRRLALVLLTNDKPQRIRVAEEIARQLEAIGMKVEVQVTGWGGFYRDFLIPRYFHAALAEQWSPNIDPDSYPFWHSSQIKEGLNFASWADRRADEILENSRRTMDQAARAELYGEFQGLFAEEQPSIFLYYPTYTYALERAIRGVRVTPLIEASDRFRTIAGWYVRTQPAAP